MIAFHKVLVYHVSCLLLAAIIGCGGSNRGAVNGQVTLDGQPVDGGIISFVPAGSESALSAWAEIQKGRYSISSTKGPGVGTNRVEVRWVRKTGRKIPADPSMGGPMEDEVIEAIPARYNSPSELRVKIRPGKNQMDFALESKIARKP